MKKTLILLTSIIGIGFFIFLLNTQQGLEINDINSTKLKLNITQDYEIDKIELISSIASKVANSHEYRLFTYDCTQFSLELEKRLKENNISAKCVRGIYHYGPPGYRISFHNWVEVNDSELGIVEIEATAGEIIDNQTYIEHYNIISRGLCW